MFVKLIITTTLKPCDYALTGGSRSILQISLGALRLHISVCSRPLVLDPLDPQP